MASEIAGRIGARVFIRRQRRGLSAEQLAALAGMHRNSIYRIERGENCSAEMLARVAKALGVPAGELLDDAPRG